MHELQGLGAIKEDALHSLSLHGDEKHLQRRAVPGGVHHLLSGPPDRMGTVGYALIQFGANLRVLEIADGHGRTGCFGGA